MIWLLSNWKVIAVIGAIIGVFGAGWHSNTVWQAYHAQKDEIKAIASLGKGQGEIVKFNSALDKEKANVKDNCVEQPIPHGFVILLH